MSDDFDIEEFMEEDSVFDDDPVQELIAWQEIFASMQQEWQIIKARYRLMKELGNDQQADEIMKDARRISEAGGKVKARIEDLRGLVGADSTSGSKGPKGRGSI